MPSLAKIPNNSPAIKKTKRGQHEATSNQWLSISISPAASDTGTEGGQLGATYMMQH
jgi:hypothetical protein